MTTLYAQPYDIAAHGFYFKSIDDYTVKASSLRNEYGRPVEEFEIQFIDGEAIDADLFGALKIDQGNFGLFLDAVEDWSDEEKTKVIIAVGDGGYGFDLRKDDPGDFEVDLYDCDTLRDLAVQFVDEGYFGDIPKAIENYLDYDAIARDLALEYASTEVAGTRYIYRIE